MDLTTTNTNSNLDITTLLSIPSSSSTISLNTRSPEQTIEVHAHRVANSRSKLPAFRYADLQPGRSKSLPVGVSLKSIGHYFEPLAIAEDGTYSQENSRRRRRRVTERITEESEISEEDLQNTWAGKARDRELVSELPSLRSRDSDVSDSGTPVPARHWHCNSGPATEQGRRADSCDSGTKLSTSPLPLAFASAQYTYDNRDILLKQRSYEGVVSERLVQQRSFGSDPTYAIEREAVTGTNANETVTTNYDPTPYIETAQRVTSTNTTDWALKQQALAFAKLDRATTTIRAVLEASSSGEKTSPNHPKTPNEHNEYERSPSPPATVVRIPRARQRQAEPPPDYFGEAYTQAQTEEGRGEGEMERDRAFYRYRTNSGHERDDSSHDEGDDDEKDALDNDETLRPMQSYTYSSPVRQESRYRGTSTTAKLEYGYDGTRSRRTSVSSIRERSPEALPSPAKTGDLFLDLAFEEMVRQRGQERERDGGGLREESAASLSRQNSRKSRIAVASNRSSAPNPQAASYKTASPKHSTTSMRTTTRRGSDVQSVSLPFTSTSSDGPSSRIGLGNRQDSFQSAKSAKSTTSSDRFSYDRPSAGAHNRATSIPQGAADSRRYPPNAGSNRSPVTPRSVLGSGTGMEVETPVSSQVRRGSLPDTVTATASAPASAAAQRAYRASNLSSFSTPRSYASSPFVAVPRATTETPIPMPVIPPIVDSTDDGTASTTAPSTVWDELDDLKSRIKKLELTGKLPPSSGAAIFGTTTTIGEGGRDRPPTATTTNTTMSLSPKRNERGRSISLTNASEVLLQKGDKAHPLLHAALAKSKSSVSTEVYSTLEQTAADALTIAGLVGSDGSGRPSLGGGFVMGMSSAQSVIGTSGVNDRQLKRKADSLCRSLTELCIALSDASNSHSAGRPTSRGKEIAAQVAAEEARVEGTRTRMGMGGASSRQVDRALSRLEARRSTLLHSGPAAVAAAPSRAGIARSELGTPSIRERNRETVPPVSLAGRRTSLLLNRRRANTEDREGNDDRQPSRAAIELGALSSKPTIRTVTGGGANVTATATLPSERVERSQRERDREALYNSTAPPQSSARSMLEVRERSERAAERAEHPLSGISGLPVRRTYSSLSPQNPSLRRYLDRTPEVSVSPRGVGAMTAMSRLADERGHRVGVVGDRGVGSGSRQSVIVNQEGVSRARSLMTPSAGGRGIGGLERLERLRVKSGNEGVRGSSDTVNSMRAEAGGYNR